MVAIHRLLKLSKLRQVLLSRGKPNIDTGGELSSCLFNSLRWVATLNFERSGPRPAPPSRDALAECVLHKLTSEQRGAQLFVVAENAVFEGMTYSQTVLWTATHGFRICIFRGQACIRVLRKEFAREPDTHDYQQ